MPKGVSVILVGRAGVLLARRAKPPFAGIWSFPGGAVEPGETHETAARRELHEETGLTAGRLREIGAFDVGAGRNYRLTVFAGTLPDRQPEAGSDAAAVAVVPFERVLTHRLTPGAPGWVAKAIAAAIDDG